METQFLPSLIAYIDGGSASMVFQAVIGGALAAGYLASARFGLVVARVRTWLRGARRTGR